MIVDGVAYSIQTIRQLVRDRHALADENRRLKARLARNDSHLQYRTAALIRLIARKGPVL